MDKSYQLIIASTNSLTHFFACDDEFMQKSTRQKPKFKLKHKTAD